MDFTRGGVAKQIALFSAPALIGNVFQQFYSIVDAVVVGRFVDGAALASVGVATGVLNFLLAALIGLTTGAAVAVSQFYGAKQYDSVNKLASTTVVLLAGLSVVVAIAGVTFAPTIINILGAGSDVAPNAVLYMRVLLGGVIFPVFYNMYTAYLRALGDSRGPLIILIFCTVLNTGLDLLFVIRFGMGVMGVAIATVIAQSASAALCFFYAKRFARELHVTRPALDAKLARLVFKYGAPAALQMSLVSLAQLSITRLINSFGTAATAGITAASRIDQIAIMPVSTVNLALSAFVGQNIGARKEDRALRGFRSSFLIMTALAISVSALLLKFGPELISMFLNPDEVGSADILKVGLDYLNIMVVFYFLFAFLFAFNGFFRGAGDAVIAMVFPVASLAIRTASAYILAYCFDMGPKSLAWSIPIGWGLTSLGSFVYYKKRLWAGKAVF